MIEVRSYDAPRQQLIETTKDQIATLLFRDPNEPFTRTEVVSQPMPHKVTYSIGNTRELHNLQRHGLFQLWSRLVEIAGIEEANHYTFGTPIEIFRGTKVEDERCEGA